MATRLRRYKYLAIGVNKPRTGRTAISILSIPLGGVFILGVLIGFNLCDVIARNCTHHRTHLIQPKEDMKSLREITSVQPVHEPDKISPK